MTQLICLVQRLSLGDEKHTLVKEGEKFDVDPETAETYIRGGIASTIKAPAPVKEPEPVKAEPAKEPDQEADNGTVQTETPEAPEVNPPKGGKKKGR